MGAEVNLPVPKVPLSPELVFIGIMDGDGDFDDAITGDAKAFVVPAAITGDTTDPVIRHIIVITMSVSVTDAILNPPLIMEGKARLKRICCAKWYSNRFLQKEWPYLSEG